MSYQSEQDRARAEANFRRAEARVATSARIQSEDDKQAAAVETNRLRLKDLRLAKEAADRENTPPVLPRRKKPSA